MSMDDRIAAMDCKWWRFCSLCRSARLIRCAFLVYQIDGFWRFWVAIFLVISGPMPSACDDPNAKESHEAAANEFTSITSWGPFEIAVEDCGSQDYRQGEEYELRWNDLRGVKPL